MIIVACSGGPDSMALLDMCRRLNRELVIAHVNFHLREESEEESELVFNYASKYNLPFYRYDCFYESGNVEAWARDQRYSFFVELANSLKAEAVLLAHHQDDLLETYLMQKEKGLGVETYGLASCIYFKNVKFLRPLLNKTKTDLINYCHKYDLAYGIDKSNYSDIYTRNIIRKKLDLYTKEDKQTLLLEIENKNKEKQAIKQACELYKNKMLKEEGFFSFEYKEDLLREKLYKDLSNKEIKELIRQVNSKTSIKIPVREKYLVREYGYIYVCRKINIKKEKINSFLELNKCQGNNNKALNLAAEDFPLTIRGIKEGDKMLLSFGHKKIKRYLIDKKIPFYLRQQVRVILNSKEEIIFVQGIGATLLANNGTLQALISFNEIACLC